MQPPLAHLTRNVDGTLREHALDEHLRKVGNLAAAFAVAFHASDWARLSGLWHDLGKYRSGLQKYIRASNNPDAHIEHKVAGPEKTHSAAGALHAIEILRTLHGTNGEVVARVFAYLIASHHAGLYDWCREAGATSDLQDRLATEAARSEYSEAVAAAPAELLRDAAGFDPITRLRDVPGLAEKNAHGERRNPMAFALWVRMLFSCLVDADFLDTEVFMDPDRHGERSAVPQLAELAEVFDQWLDERDRGLRNNGDAESAVNRARGEVLAQCRQKAWQKASVFTLTVPTGGGKTLSSLAFALDHARTHGKRRVIYAIPYTSIIEQTAEVFRNVFVGLGPNAVVEHHSQAEADAKAETAASRLACENWDAPLVVTTNVQLFESLFAARTSRCRKLHNLVNSVIILDEAQQLPPEYLQPILDTLHLLSRHYGATIVICTATQPALTSTQYFDAVSNLRGIDGAVEIMDDPDALYSALTRVQVKLPTNLHTPREWHDLAAEVGARDAVLVIVNKRQDARELGWRCISGRWATRAPRRGLKPVQRLVETLARARIETAIRREAVRPLLTALQIRG